jgi:hypothetical protein
VGQECSPRPGIRLYVIRRPRRPSGQGWPSLGLEWQYRSGSPRPPCSKRRSRTGGRPPPATGWPRSRPRRGVTGTSGTRCTPSPRSSWRRSPARSRCGSWGLSGVDMSSVALDMTNFAPLRDRERQGAGRAAGQIRPGRCARRYRGPADTRALRRAAISRGGERLCGAADGGRVPRWRTRRQGWLPMSFVRRLASRVSVP